MTGRVWQEGGVTARWTAGLEVGRQDDRWAQVKEINVQIAKIMFEFSK